MRKEFIDWDTKERLMCSRMPCMYSMQNTYMYMYLYTCMCFVLFIHIYCTWRLCKFNFVDEILHSVKFLSTINMCMNVHVHVG